MASSTTRTQSKSPHNRLSSASTVKQDQLIAQERQNWSETNSTLLDGFEQRWVDFNAPVGASVALAKCLLVIAHWQSHDPILLHRVTGYSLRFANMLVSGLLRSKLWLSYGYEELIANIQDHPNDQANIDNLLGSLMEQLWHDVGLNFNVLEEEWLFWMNASDYRAPTNM